MQTKNLIVPLVGDFAGPKAIRAVGEYATQHDAAVTVFYASNVEEYIRTPPARYLQYCGNIATLPVNPDSTLIRWAGGPNPSTFLSPMADFVAAYQARRPFPYEIPGPRAPLQFSCY